MEIVRQLRSLGISLIARLMAAAQAGEALADVLAAVPEAKSLRVVP